MKQADIKVWVLTGDKMGTAQHIGLSTGLLEPDMIDKTSTLYRITDKDYLINQEANEEDVLTKVYAHNKFAHDFYERKILII